MSRIPVFTGSGTAVITPMTADGAVDYKVYREFIEFQIENKTDAIISCGTTGESSTLNRREHVAVLQTAIEQAKGRVPVIAGTGSNDTASCIELSREACRLGADALLLVTPYYNKTSQRGLLAHYTAVADAVDRPILLYNVPSRTGLNLRPATAAALARHPRIVGLKQANGSMSETAEIAASCDLSLYAGNDSETVPLLSLGGVGVISVLANLMPLKMHELCARWFSGDTEESRRLQLELLPLCDALFSDVNPIPVKEALRLMGWPVGPCRLPLYSMTEEKRAALADVLRRYHLL